MTTVAGPEEVLRFWFGELDAEGLADEAHAARWWRHDPAFDQEVRARFGTTHDALREGACETWRAQPASMLAYVIGLDQFSRNLFRGDARAFACDEQALSCLREGLEHGSDRALRGERCLFFYMPLMHSEQLADQDHAVALLEALAQRCRSQRAEGRIAASVKSARAHRAIIARWGRFPHRNAALGRESTRDELEFLKQPGSSF